MGVFPPLYSERLILREFEKTDLDEIHDYLSDPDVLQFMMHDITDKKGSQGYLNRFLQFQKDEPRLYIRFTVILKNTGSLIGECGLNMPNYLHREGEIVYRLSKKYWGNGYASEAAKKIIEFGFNQLGLHRIEAMCDVRNIASVNVLEKIGMKKEGYLREHRWIKERWRDSLLFSILEDEFANFKV